MSDKRKKLYRKPQIQQVKLVPEEAVLGGCKTATTATASVSQGTGCSQSSCVDNGTS